MSRSGAPRPERSNEGSDFGATLLSADEAGQVQAQLETEGTVEATSAREEKEMQALLEMFAMGVGAVDEFQAKLQEELSALEAANVHAILESGPVVAGVVDRLDGAISLIDDLDENLNIFDVKLRHMREDIAAIEARNNSLELQARNNAKLLAALETLLERLHLPQNVERALTSATFTSASLDGMVGAGWVLKQHLAGLGEGGQKGLLEPGLAGMTAVIEQTARLQALSRAYVDRGSSFVQAELSRLTDATLARASAGQNDRNSRSGAWSPPDPTLLQAQCGLLAPLLQVIWALQAGSIGAVRAAFCQRMNMLMRRELRGGLQDLRRAAATAPGSDADLLRDLAKDSMASRSGSFAEPGIERSNLSGSGASRRAALLQQKSPSGAATGPFLAYRMFLRGAVPFISGQLQFTTSFLMLNQASPPSNPGAVEEPLPKTRSLGQDGAAVLAALVEGIDADFQAMVDAGAKGGQVQCVPMLAETLAWRGRVGEGPIFAPLRHLLQDAQQRLAVLFNQATVDLVASLARYGAKGTISLQDSVKALHVLPFIPNFAALAAQIQAMLSEEPAAAHLPTPRSARAVGVGTLSRDTPGSSRLGRTTSGRQTVSDTGSLDFMDEGLDEADTANSRRPSDAERATGSGDGSRPQSAQPAANGSVNQQLAPAPRTIMSEADLPEAMPPPAEISFAREVVEWSYAVVVRAMFAALERVAATDPKHGIRLRLENYSAFVEGLTTVGQDDPVINFFVRQAASMKAQTLSIYIAQQLEYGKYNRIVEFSERLESLMAEVGPGEVAFQPGHQPTNVKQMLSTTMARPDKRLAEMRARTIKHLGASSPALAHEIWSACERTLVMRYRRLGEQLTACYGNLHLSPSPQDLAAMFKAAA
ncbi:hypothetical protein WJX74_010160 [Apatococcus lobatus]|uniref:Exocyst complex component Sec3 C-terminal domain-containing protein n=1 Tax=Apatococcus lobatus TaxID=904363 RepID=A0AAW1QH49_9CHLO